jgi:peptidoglycan/xylan/chitin deacetylase (PgdA/CDA1 family)
MKRLLSFQAKLYIMRFHFLLIFSIAIHFSCKKDSEAVLGPGIILTIDKPPGTYAHLRDFLKEHKAKLTYYIEAYPQLYESDKQLLRDFESDGHEIAHHSLTHVHADDYAAKHGVDAYINDEIIPVTLAMKQDGFSPQTFAYPHGDNTAALDKALLKHFKNIRKIIAPYLHKSLYDMDQVYLNRKNVKIFFAAGIDARYHISEEELMRALEKAKNSKQTISLYCHFLSKDGIPLEGSNSHISEDLFKKLIQKAYDLNLTFYTARDLSK